MQNLLLVIIKFFSAMHMWNVYNTFLYEIFLQVLIYFLPLEKCKSIITSNLKNLHSKLGIGKYKE